MCDAFRDISDYSIQYFPAFPFLIRFPVLPLPVFLRKKRLGSLRDLERKDLAQSPAVTVAPESDRKTTAKEDFQKRKAAAREERKIRSQVSFLESEIARFEEDMKKIEQILANPGENDDILALTTTYLDDKRNVEIMTEEWGKLIEKLEE